MKQLRETLVLTDARVLALNRVNTKDGYTEVMKVKGPLNPALADTLRCRNQAYTLNDTSYPCLSSFTLDHEISSCELAIRGHGKLQPTIVTGFTIVPSKAADADGDLELHFRLKFSEYERELNAIFNSVKNNPFDLSLVALQASLFDAPAASTGDGESGGKRVNMSGADPDEDEDEDEQEDPPPVEIGDHTAAVRAKGARKAN